MKYLKDIDRFVEKKVVFCGIDIHLHHWDLCFMSSGVLLERVRIPSGYSQLTRHLSRDYSRAHQLHFVYEAGFSGFHLCRQLRTSGYHCIITPPNRVPAYHDKVKTDKRDALKLAQYLSGGLLKEVYVPPVTVELDRHVLRQRHAAQKKLTRVKNEIKSLLHLHGIEKPESVGNAWTKSYVAWLHTQAVSVPDLQFVLDNHLAEYHFYRTLIAGLTRQLRSLSQSEAYSSRFKLLITCRGIGLITAMTYLLELSDIGRFPTADHLSSYLGLTPSQHSSGSHVRLGHITREGNAHVRRVLVESAWTVIRHDPFLRAKYDRIKAKGTNGKKAIVAVAHSLAIRLRRCLVDGTPYQMGCC